jgi:hypothetical protein
MDFSALIEKIKYVSAIKGIIEVGSTIDDVIMRKMHTERVECLKDIREIYTKNRNIKYVSGKAYFSEYAHTFRPLSYSDLRPGQLDKNDTWDTQRDEYVTHFQIHNEFTPLPIQSFRSVGTTLGDYRFGFLYPQDFNGFIYPENSIPENAKPIPVIYESSFASCLGSNVDFTAEIIDLPDRSIAAFKNLQHIGMSLFSNVCAPYNLDRVNLCLKVNGKDTVINRDRPMVRQIKGSLYAEGHFEGIEGVKDLPFMLSNIIPGGEPQIFAYQQQGDNCYFTNTGKVRVSFREPNIISCYINSNLNSENDFAADIEEMRSFLEQVNQSLQIVVTYINPKARPQFYLDFLFDYSRQFLYQQAGVLASQKLANNLCDPVLYCTRDWLREKR